MLQQGTSRQKPKDLIIFIFVSVPSAPPTSIKGQNTSSTSINVTWDEIPTDDKNGIIIQYHIQHRIYQGINPNWTYSVINASNSAIELTGLKFYTFYEIKMAGATSVGVGTYSSPIVTRTDADGMLNNEMI